MFDIGFAELILLAIIALFVIGPEKLPHTVRMISAFIRKIRISLSDMQYEIERELDVQDLKKQIQNQLDDTGLKDLQASINEANAQTSKIRQQLNDSNTTQNNHALSNSPSKNAATNTVIEKNTAPGDHTSEP